MFTPDSCYAAVINPTALDCEGNAGLLIRAAWIAHLNGGRLCLAGALALSGPELGTFAGVPGFLTWCQNLLLKIKYNLPDGVILGVGLPLAGAGKHGAECIYDAYVLITRARVLGISVLGLIDESGRRLPLPAEVTGDAEAEGSLPHFELDGQDWQAAWCIQAGELRLKVTPLECASLKAGISRSDYDLWVVPQAVRLELPHAFKADAPWPGAAEQAAESAEAALRGCKDLRAPVLTVNLVGCPGGADLYDGVSRWYCPTAHGVRVSSSRLLPYERVSLFSLEKAASDDQPGRLREVLHPQLDAEETYDGSEAVLRALGLGIFDWLVKTKSGGLALSLSGGADSALCAALTGYAMAAALEDLGFEPLIALLKDLFPYIQDPVVDHATFIRKKLMPRVLLTVYQASAVSGSITRAAAAGLAKDLGSSHHEWSVAGQIAGYEQLLREAGLLHDNVSPGRLDLALQNIQARSRAPAVWLAANLENRLLMVTCNASEDAVGYCTMDGDTAGGVAPLGGLSKSRILEINRRIAAAPLKVRGKCVFNLPAMAAVACQEPTAELRAGQTDERDLMPYVILDRIHELQQGCRLLPSEVCARLREDFPELGAEQAWEYVRRYFARLASSQWKRERGAVSFHLESCDLSAGRGFDMPVLNGGLRGLLPDEAPAS